jgi:transcriptional regulator GlxA family with amidase domain
LPRALRGGLAPWQERRAKEILDARLDGGVSLATLAGACDLSVRHFSRAFRQSTGQSPHRWLLERRLDRARGLLELSAQSLSEIAAACGFANQSHFTRTFTRAVALSPGAWRRLRRS